VKPWPFLCAGGLALCAFAAAESPSGKVEEFRISSEVLQAGRRVWVYTPPGYLTSGTPCDLLVVFDGREYLEDIGLARTLDGLLAEKKAGPFVALLTDNASGAERLADLANRARFADFLAREAVEWVRGRYRVARDPRRVFVAGSSAGGLAAAYAAFRHPEVFGNVLSQSGAFWRGNEGSNDEPYEWLRAQFASAPKKDIRFVLEVGTGESVGALGGAAPSILESNRRLRDALRAGGYSVAYVEIPGGRHATETWGARFPEALARLARAAGR